MEKAREIFSDSDEGRFSEVKVVEIGSRQVEISKQTLSGSLGVKIVFIFQQERLKIKAQRKIGFCQAI